MPSLLTKRALPFIVLVLGGAFAIKTVNQIKFDVLGERSKISRIERLKGGSLQQNSPEEEFEELKKKIDLDNWENKRIVKPWEMEENEKKANS